MAENTSSRLAARLFWGRTEEISLYTRVVALVFLIVAIASMSFCQLGFWPVGEIDGVPLYLI